MYTKNLSIKPPKIYWTPLATIGLSASLGSYFGGAESVQASPFSTITTALCVGIFALGIKNKTQFPLLVFVVGLFFFTRAQIESTHSGTSPWVYLLDGDIVRINGMVTNSPTIKNRTTGDMKLFDYRQSTTTLQMSGYLRNQEKQKTTINVVCNGRIKLTAGDKISCVGWLRKPIKKYTHPSLFVSGPESIVLVNKGEYKTPVQRNIKTRVLKNIKGDELGLAKSIFFGEREGGWTKQSVLFRKSGMSHVLAMSGMHIAILMFFCTTTLSIIKIKNRQSILISLTVALLLLSIVETRPPVVRAVVMLCTILCIKALRINCGTISVLGISAIVILLVNPRDAGTVGFQLSFIVVASLCVLLPTITWRMAGPVDVNALSRNMATRRLCTVWITGLCAWLASVPQVLYIFGTFTPVGILSNIPSLVALVFSLWSGVAKALVFSLPEYIQTPFLVIFNESLSFMLFVARVFNDVPLGYFGGIYAPWYCGPALIVCVVAWSLKVKNRGRMYFCIVITLCALFCFSGHRSENTIITTIDVGHGTCHVLQNMRYTMVIDAGSRNNFDIGLEKIIPILRLLGVTKINTLVITHSDIDHVAGVIDIAQNIPVSKIIIAPQTIQNQTPPLKKTLQTLAGLGIEIHEASAGWNERSDNIHITMLSPDKHEVHRSSNATSIVLLVETHNRKIVFTGDIDEKKIMLLAHKIPIDTDVLELPHHGQWSRESQALVEKLTPSVVLQSTNKTRHANDKWVIPLNTSRFVTAVDGTISTNICSAGTISVIGDSDPVTMAPCMSHKQ